MNDVAIRAEGLSKRYRLGELESYRTLREALVRAASWRSVRGLFSRRGGDRADTIWALKDLTFEVQRGEVLGIVGRNGAGKSTLLKVLARITEPTAGYADVYGRVGSLLEVGTGFHPELTGRENIFLYGAIMGMKRSEMQLKLDRIVAFAELEKFIDTPVKRYSSGMYMRLAFSVAAHIEASNLLIDEVLAVGDTRFQKKCLGKMGDVASQDGRTVLFVSHNMNAIHALCERVIVLHHGEIVFAGETLKGIEEYTRINDEGGERVEDLRERRRTAPHFGTQVRLVRCRLEADGGIVAWKEPVRFSMEVEIAGGAVDEIMYGIGICDAFGARIGTWEGNVGYAVGSARRLAVDVEIREPKLLPSLYWLDVGLRSGGYTHDYVPRALSFEVDAVGRDLVPKGFSHGPASGYIEVELDTRERVLE